MNLDDVIARKERELAECLARRESILTALREVIDTAQVENRALNDFEAELFDELEAEAKALRAHIPRLGDSLSADKQHAENTRGMGVSHPIRMGTPDE